MAIPLLKSLDLQDKDITADALLTQRKLAEHLVKKRHAHYHFTVKANQATLLEDLALMFQDRKQPDFVMHDPPDHGRIETRNIWTTTALNDYLDFPYVGQAFAIERIAIDKKPATPHAISPTALPAVPPNKPIPNACSKLTGATGLSKTAAITSSIGTMTRTAAASAPATAPRTSPACAASPSV